MTVNDHLLNYVEPLRADCVILLTRPNILADNEEAGKMP